MEIHFFFRFNHRIKIWLRRFKNLALTVFIKIALCTIDLLYFVYVAAMIVVDKNLMCIIYSRITSYGMQEIILVQVLGLFDRVNYTNFTNFATRVIRNLCN
jgi:predicted Kef-type K+ transport protein